MQEQFYRAGRCSCHVPCSRGTESRPFMSFILPVAENIMRRRTLLDLLTSTGESIDRPTNFHVQLVAFIHCFRHVRLPKFACSAPASGFKLCIALHILRSLYCIPYVGSCFPPPLNAMAFHCFCRPSYHE